MWKLRKFALTLFSQKFRVSSIFTKKNKEDAKELISRNIFLRERFYCFATCTLWKLQKFTLTENFFVKSTIYLVFFFSLGKMLLSRIFCTLQCASYCGNPCCSAILMHKNFVKSLSAHSVKNYLVAINYSINLHFWYYLSSSISTFLISTITVHNIIKLFHEILSTSFPLFKFLVIPWKLVWES